MKPSIETMILYQEGRLSNDERKQVELYINENPSAHSEYERIESLNGVLEDWGRSRRVLDSVKAAAAEARDASSSRAWRPTLQLAPMPAALAACFLAACAGLLWMAIGSGSLPVYQYATDGLAYVSNLNQHQLEIRTEPESYASVTMPDGSVSEYGPETYAFVRAPRKISLERGSLWNDVERNPEQAYEVITPHCLVTVLGTRFEVVVDHGETVVRVLEGKVRVKSRQGGELVELTANQESRTAGADLTQPRQITADIIAEWRQTNRSGRIDTRQIYNGLQQQSR